MSLHTSGFRYFTSSSHQTVTGVYSCCCSCCCCCYWWWWWCVAESRVCDRETVDGVTWNKTRAGRYDIQPCPPSFTGRQSSLINDNIQTNEISSVEQKLSRRNHRHSLLFRNAQRTIKSCPVIVRLQMYTIVFVHFWLNPRLVSYSDFTDNEVDGIWLWFLNRWVFRRRFEVLAVSRSWML